MEKNKKVVKKSFETRRINTFLIHFPNGNSASTIWGSGSYTENHDVPFGIGWEKPIGSDTVEVMYDCGKRTAEKISKIVKSDENPIEHLFFNEWLKVINLLAEEKQTSKK